MMKTFYVTLSNELKLEKEFNSEYAL